MKINELIQTFEIWMSNEEREVLERLERPQMLAAFNEREQVIIRNLHHKSLVSKVANNGCTFVVKNG